ncbi:MAG: IS4 family transposase, partial [Planctomycetes bacterium]|nr:IS4 family transposase [Planctomycetota bacterium]
MPYAWIPGTLKKKHDTYCKMMLPVNNALPDLTPLTSGCNRPLQMTFEDQINILVYFHLEEHHSGRHLLQVLNENHFARQYIAPEKGIKKSSFFEDISSRGLEQMVELFGKIYI